MSKEYTTLLMLQIPTLYVAAIELCCHDVIGYLITIQKHTLSLSQEYDLDYASIKKLLAICVSVQISSHCDMFLTGV